MAYWRVITPNHALLSTGSLADQDEEITIGHKTYGGGEIDTRTFIRGQGRLTLRAVNADGSAFPGAQTVTYRPGEELALPSLPGGD